MADKPLIWLGSSQRDLKAFPQDARSVAGFQLRRVQQGLEPNDWKPMTEVGAGVQEIRLHTGLEHRVSMWRSLPKVFMFCMPSRSELGKLPIEKRTSLETGFVRWS